MSENTTQAPSAPWKELVQVMTEQAQAYEGLLDFLKDKQQAIIQGDTNKLKAMEAEEKDHICKLENLEDVRIETAAECSTDKESEITLKKLMEHVPEEHREPLEQVAVRLMDALNSVALTNKSNAELIDEAMKFTEYTLNLLSSTGDTEESTYESSGRLRESENKIKGFLNKQV